MLTVQLPTLLGCYDYLIYQIYLIKMKSSTFKITIKSYHYLHQIHRNQQNLYKNKILNRIPNSIIKTTMILAFYQMIYHNHHHHHYHHYQHHHHHSIICYHYLYQIYQIKVNVIQTEIKNQIHRHYHRPEISLTMTYFQ